MRFTKSGAVARTCLLNEFRRTECQACYHAAAFDPCNNMGSRVLSIATNANGKLYKSMALHDLSE